MSETQDEAVAEAGTEDELTDDHVDVGEQTDEADTPVPEVEEGDEHAAGIVPRPAGDKLHAAMAKAVSMGLVITSTTGGKHTATSYHYSKPYRTIVIAGRKYQVGRAADVAKAGNPDALYRKVFHALEGMRPTEMFYDPIGYYWKNGNKVNGAIGGHRDHIHIAF